MFINTHYICLLSSKITKSTAAANSASSRGEGELKRLAELLSDILQVCPRPDFPRDEASSAVAISSAARSSDRCQGKPGLSQLVWTSLMPYKVVRHAARLLYGPLQKRQHVGHTLFRKKVQTNHYGPRLTRTPAR